MLTEENEAICHQNHLTPSRYLRDYATCAVAYLRQKLDCRYEVTLESDYSVNVSWPIDPREPFAVRHSIDYFATEFTTYAENANYYLRGTFVSDVERDANRGRWIFKYEFSLYETYCVECGRAL